MATRKVGRLVTVDRSGLPDVFPVNYVLDGDVVVFRTDEGTKLRIAEGRNVAGRSETRS